MPWCSLLVQSVAEQTPEYFGRTGGCGLWAAVGRGFETLSEHLLAPVRNDRKSAGKTTAGSAGLGVSRHASAAVGGEAGGDDAAGEKESLQGVYPPAPSAGTGAVESRSCLVSSLTDSITR